MLCYHQNTKPGIVTFGPTISPFDNDKTYELFKRKSREELCKNSPSSYSSYQVQDINNLYDKGIV